MELSVVKDGGVLIAGPNASIVVDGQSKVSGDIFLFMDKSSSLIEQDIGDSLVIVGPGEYEVGGFLIHGEITEHGAYYVISFGNEKLLLVSSRDTSSISSDGRYGTILVKLEDEYDENISSSLPGELILLYGDSQFTNDLKLTRADKIGKRKRSELTGETVLLSK